MKVTSSSEMNSILIVDDSPDTQEVISRNLQSARYKVFTASSVDDALKILSSTGIDLVITDLKMPGIGGLELIRYVRENFKDIEIMMITGYPSIESAVEAVKTGAEEYLAKPFTDGELFSAVQRAFDKLNVRRSQRLDSPRSSSVSQGLLGESQVMRRVFTAVSKAASTSAIVLITGESGTGKEIVARAIHYNSSRASAPFVPVNCGSIPDGLIESELFGHTKGAFTGAVESRAGFFQTADGGTIFLDEISNTSMSMQARLLRVLQDGEICMVGSGRPRKVDVRIIAATNKDLYGLVRQDLFREDLFFRLNVITIVIPPLRERGKDMLLLINHFVKKFSREAGKSACSMSDDVLRIFQSYPWPGNVRELENLIRQLIIMTDEDVIDVPDLPPHMRFSVSGSTAVMRTLAEVEAGHIRHVLELTGGNKTKAAEILGIDRKTLREKLNKGERP